MVEFAIYKGDTFLMIGTAEECAAELNVKPESIRWMASPSGIKRSKSRKDQSKALSVVRLD